MSMLHMRKVPPQPSPAHVCKLSRTCNRVRNKANTLIDAKHRGYPTPFIICCDGMRDDHNVSDYLTDCLVCKVISYNLCVFGSCE